MSEAPGMLPTVLIWSGFAFLVWGVYEWFGLGPAAVIAGLILVVLAFGYGEASDS